MDRLRNKLVALRQKQGLKQQEVAERVGITRQSLSAIEVGNSTPSTTVALRLAQALECRVEDLFWLEETGASLVAEVAGVSGMLKSRTDARAADQDPTGHVVQGRSRFGRFNRRKMGGAALAHGLEFLPLAEERFDLVIPKELSDDARVTRLLDTLSGRPFRREIESLGGYEVRESGSLIT